MIPIHKIPTELLSEIFDAYANQYRPCDSLWHPTHQYNDLLRLMHVPAHLGAVCQDWRYTAFSTPSLWRVLLLESPNDTEAIAEVEKRIQRSGDLTLSLYAYETNGVSAKAMSRPLESFIDRHSHRWYHIELVLPQYSLNDRLGFQLGNSERMFPFLRRIALGSIYATVPNQSTFEAAAERVPRLTSLSLSELNVYIIQAPWDQLTVLDLHYVDFSETIFALNRTPRLVHLRVMDLFHRMSNNNIPFATDPLILPHLQTLDIVSYDHSMDVRSLLAYLQAPNIKRLRCQTTPCPWTKKSQNDALNVLIPSPETSCPELIIVGEINVDEHPKFDLEFVQTHAPYSHILHLWDSRRWTASRDAIPCLWDDLSHLCHLCLLHEEGNDSEEYGVRHPTGISFHPPSIGHIGTPCAVCLFHGMIQRS